jgi:hypothetical protein
MHWPNRSLLDSQWNDVFAAIQAAGLNPAEFERTEASSPRANGHVPVLHHPPSKATFTFDFDDTQHWADYTPGNDRPRDERAAGNWDGQLNYVKQWLEYLKREWHAPNLWAELRAQRRLVTAIGGASDDSNAPFGLEEQKEIARQLAEIKTYVRKTYQLNESQYEAIDARLDYFAEAAKRLGRIDWRNAFIGAFLGAVLQAVLPPEPVQDIISLALRSVGHAFGVDIPELPR